MSRRVFIFSFWLGFTTSFPPSIQAQTLDSLWTVFSGQNLDPDRIKRNEPVVGEMIFYHQAANDDRYRAFVDWVGEQGKESAFLQYAGLHQLLVGRLHERDHQMDLAIEHYSAAIDTLTLIEDDWNLATAYYRTGNALINSGLYEQSFTPMQKALPLSIRSGNLRLQCELYDFLGDYYYYSGFGQENYDSSLHYYQLCRSCLDRFDMGKWMEADLANGFANTYRELGQLEKGEEEFEYAIASGLESKNYGTVYAAYIDKAESYKNKGQYKEALVLQEEGYTYVLRSGQLSLIKRAHEQLYLSYQNLGKDQEALFHYQQFRHLQDSMSRGATMAKLAELETRLQSELKDQKITQLENQNLRQSRNIILMLSAIGILITGLLAMGYVRAQRNLKAVEARNREITSAQLRGQNLERKRMAAELHDNLNTKIAAVRWQLEAIRPQAEGMVGKVLDKSINLISDVYGDVRLISHNLIPETVEALGLIPSLRNLLTQLVDNDRTKFNLVSDIPDDSNFGEITYHLYNIIFEMINNILKHADAKNAWISLHVQKSILYINISDDGVGFEVDQMTDGYGIRNITSRLENINGQWTIESAPGEGTKYQIEAPFLIGR